MKTYWLSSEKMTFTATVSEAGVVIQAAPIVRKFIGQPYANLLRWMRAQGGLRVEELK